MSSEPTLIGRQLINIEEHNKYIHDNKWPRSIIITEKLFYSDGSSYKNFIIEDDPSITFHKTIDENYLKQPTFSVPLEECEPYEVKFNFATRTAAEITDQLPYYKTVYGRDRKRVHLHKDLHGSDVNIVDHYISRYYDEFADEIIDTVPLVKAYFDIEVDAYGLGDFPEPEVAPVPVNLINYFCDSNRVLHIYLNPYSHLTDDFFHPDAKRLVEDETYRNSFKRELLLFSNFGKIKKLTKEGQINENNCIIPKDMKTPTAEVLELMRKELSNKSTAELKTILRCYSIQFHIFDNEFDLIKEFLNRVVNIDKPDVISAWNARFDILTLINRLYRLGIDPEELFTPTDLGKWGLIDYKSDTRNDQPTDIKDKFTCIGYSIWADQMLLFASLRKQSGKRRSYSLSAILTQEIDEDKVDLGEMGGITEVPYRCYETFLKYGAIDVVPLSTLEDGVGDIDSAYKISAMTRSAFHKNMTKTNILRNFAAKFFKDNGLILSNNRNAFNETAVKFRAAYVAAPRLMGNAGEYIDGIKSSKVFANAVDFDAKSMYPSIIRAAHIDPEALIGKIYFIGEDQHSLIIADIFTEVFLTGNAVELGSKYFNLPSMSELMDIISE